MTLNDIDLVGTRTMVLDCEKVTSRLDDFDELRDIEFCTENVEVKRFEKDR